MAKKNHETIKIFTLRKETGLLIPQTSEEMGVKECSNICRPSKYFIIINSMHLQMFSVLIFFSYMLDIPYCYKGCLFSCLIGSYWFES